MKWQNTLWVICYNVKDDGDNNGYHFIGRMVDESELIPWTIFFGSHIAHLK